MTEEEIRELEVRELVEVHWEWLESLLHKVYVDAMIHGIKHGQEIKRKRKRKRD